MQEALKQVKDALGDDAIIVSSREEDGGWVRITAAVEKMPERPQPKEEPEGYDDETVIEMITDVLLKHRVPGSVSEKIIAAASILNNNDPQKTLAKALEKTFKFTGKRTDRPLILVGPPGAGKTLMTAKLAAECVMDGKKPVIVTTDIARAGAVEQLTAFLDIMKVPLHQADDAKSLQHVLSLSKGQSPVIIDTGGLNPFDPQEMKHLARLMMVTEMNAALVLPAGMDAEETAEMAQTFEILGVRQLIPTRLDFARRIGGILSAADKAGLVFDEASRTPQVASGVTHLTSHILAEMLMPQPASAAAAKTKKGVA
jgi:flagellar biosynthesis protein FlhF